jgi:predicted transcriptional regulator
MHIRFRAGDSDRIEEALESLDRGESPDPYLERVYHDPDELHRITRPKNLELLRTIVRERPASIRETARFVDRDVRQVHRNLEELEALGLLEFEETDRAKRPQVWYDEIAVELPLGSGDYDESDTAEA